MKLSLRRLGGLAAIVAGVAGIAVAVLSLFGAADKDALKSNNLTGIRAEALTLFPRGSRLDEAAAHMAKIGFDCAPIEHLLPDISGPSLRCASSGRGYPNFPAVNVILVTRNGLVSDVDVWNIMARADGERDDIDFTATGAAATLPSRLHGPGEPDLELSEEADAATR